MRILRLTTTLFDDMGSNPFDDIVDQEQDEMILTVVFVALYTGGTTSNTERKTVFVLLTSSNAFPTPSACNYGSLSLSPLDAVSDGKSTRKIPIIALTPIGGQTRSVV